jgi:hypothetical protein
MFPSCVTVNDDLGRPTLDCAYNKRAPLHLLPPPLPCHVQRRRKRYRPERVDPYLRLARMLKASMAGPKRRVLCVLREVAPRCDGTGRVDAYGFWADLQGAPRQALVYGCKLNNKHIAMRDEARLRRAEWPW